MSQRIPEDKKLSLDGYAIVGLTYEELTKSFNSGDRIPVTAVKSTIDGMITTFGTSNVSSPAVMREMESQGLIERDQREYCLR